MLAWQAHPKPIAINEDSPAVPNLRGQVSTRVHSLADVFLVLTLHESSWNPLSLASICGIMVA
jgi:hypothetical protein